MKTTETKTIDQAIKEGNSITNQNIKSQFISKHVYSNVNQMVEYILGNSGTNAPFDYDDVQNYFSYPEYIGEYASFEGGSEEDKDKEIERLQEIENDLLDKDGKKLQKNRFKHEKIKEEIEALENLETEYADIFEWWIVSDYLCRKLSEKGYPVIEDSNIWGRTTTGQAILLDGVITRICAEMEILEGQSNSWANHK